MRVKISVPEEHVSPDVVNAALEAVTRIDEQLLAAGQVPPFDPHNPQVRWRPEPYGEEHFDNAGIVLGRGWGDCDDLAPWRAASLRASGEDPGATAIVLPSGPSTYHALVQRSDGSMDEPSVAAGVRVQGGRTTVVGGGGAIHMQAIDPHDGCLYEGSLLPTCGPLSTVVGPSWACRPRPELGVWEARCDTPIIGSRMVHVRNYWRHRAHRTRRRAHGVVPYSLANICCHPDRRAALVGAVWGAMMLAPPSEHGRYMRFLRRQGA